MKFLSPFSLTLIATSALASASFPAMASVLVGTSSSGDALYADVLSTDAGVKNVRTRTVFGSPKTLEELPGILATSAIEEIDCIHATRRTRRIEFYQNAEASGSPAWARDLSTVEKPASQFRLNEQSASTLLYAAVCGVPSSTRLGSNTPASPALPASNTNPPERKAASLPGADPLLAISKDPISENNGSSSLPPPTPETLSKSVSTTPPTQAPARPTPAAEPTMHMVQTIGDGRPFNDSAFSLGTMGLLAEYVYFDEKELAFREALLRKIQAGRDRIYSDGRKHPLVDQAFTNISANTTHYRDKFNAKNMFLASAALKLLPLPNLSLKAPNSFRAELYEHVPSHEKILVFRGTQSAMDWFSNLWSGIDMLEIEAPHYQSAYEVIRALKRRGDTPVVVGHSLGGGMAQYVGNKFGLKVVGFNSAPLPKRYFSDGAALNVKYVRLFSAVEISGRRNPAGLLEGYADPVSIELPNNASGRIKDFFSNYEPIKAHQQLVKPICVKSVPVPYVTDEERKSYFEMFNAFLSKGIVGAAFGKIIPDPKTIGTDMAMVYAIRDEVKAGLSDPIWQPDSKSKEDQRVAEEVKKEVAKVAVEQYKAIGGTAAVAKGGYKFAMGKSWGDMLAGAGSLGMTLGKMAAADFIMTHILYPHSMERLNRGMQSAADADVFVAEPVREQCSDVKSVF